MTSASSVKTLRGEAEDEFTREDFVEAAASICLNREWDHAAIPALPPDLRAVVRFAEDAEIFDGFYREHDLTGDLRRIERNADEGILDTAKAVRIKMGRLKSAKPTRPSKHSRNEDPAPEPRQYNFITLGEAGRFIGEQEWLWSGWVPVGHVTLLGGRPQVGKTFFAEHVALVATGQEKRFLDDSVPERTGAVLWVDFEGQLGTLHHRLVEGGFDPDAGIHCLDLTDPTQDTPGLLKRDAFGERFEFCNVIEQAAAKIPGLVLVVIDSLFAGTGGDGENESKVGAPLAAMGELAASLKVAILVLHHPRKGKGDEEDGGGDVPLHTIQLDDLRGSGSIGGTVRSAIGIDRPSTATTRRVRLIKSSLLAHRPDGALGFDLRDALVVPCETPSANRNPKRASRTEETELWLEHLLAAEGPVLQEEVRARASSEGFSWRTVGEASRNLKVLKERVDDRDIRSPYQWRLPPEPETSAWLSEDLGDETSGKFLG